MPVILLAGGLLLLVSAAAGTTASLGLQLRKDFTGPQSFLYWLAALGVLALLGYVDRFRELSRSLMVLVLLGMVLRNGTGVFARLTQAITTPPTPVAGADRESTSSSASAPGGAAGGSPSSDGVPVAQIGQAISLASLFA